MENHVVEFLQRWGQLSASSGLALGAFFAMAGFIVIPRTPFVVTAGATFGLWAVPIIILGGMVGSILAFLLSRHTAAGWVRRKLARRPHLEAVARAVDLEGWRIIALMRLGVPVPGSVQNFLFGLTSIDLPTYAISTLVFASPQVFLFAYLGASGRASLLEDHPPGLMLLSAALTLVAMLLISWRVKRMLQAKGIDAERLS
jgi:uncharacterized membrane protein YdjX (TVP38/TMEM64 family)